MSAHRRAVALTATPGRAVERVALVTGAARGIGAATVRRLVADGYGVVAVDWCAESHEGVPYPLPSRADLDALVANHPDAIVGVVADVRDRESLARAVLAAMERWGRLDVVVAAAAIMLGGAPLWETPVEDLDLLWDIDTRGVWNTAAACMPTMLGSVNPGGCRFVAVASAAGTHGLFRLAAYNVTKYAVVGLVKGLAADLVGTASLPPWSLLDLREPTCSPRLQRSTVSRTPTSSPSRSSSAASSRPTRLPPLSRSAVLWRAGWSTGPWSTPTADSPE